MITSGMMLPTQFRPVRSNISSVPGAIHVHPVAPYLIGLVGQLYARLDGREPTARKRGIGRGLDDNIVIAMLFKNLRDEIDATLARDPAARARTEVALCYPGFQALLYYRAAHWLWERGWHLAGRFLSH